MDREKNVLRDAIRNPRPGGAGLLMAVLAAMALGFDEAVRKPPAPPAPAAPCGCTHPKVCPVCDRKPEEEGS